MVILFAATMFAGATLLFLVQPMFAKMVLPLVGGTPSAWNTCVLFFQLTLLAGYLWAHATLRWLGPRRQAWRHLILLLAPLLVLPVGIPAGWAPPAGGSPVPWLLGLLFVAVGPPLLAVSTTAPTLQRWFSVTGHPSARDPYFLYAASNLGSILALVSYPLLVEPLLRVRTQALAWTAAYVVLVVLVGVCALALQKRGRRDEPAAAGARPIPPADKAGPPDGPGPPSGGLHGVVAATDAAGRHAEPESVDSTGPVNDRPAMAGANHAEIPRHAETPLVDHPFDDGPATPGVNSAELAPRAATPLDGHPPDDHPIDDRPVTAARRLRWLALSAVPSSLMLGVTLFVSTDVAPMPLLWVVPLALYLLTFVIAFSPRLQPIVRAAPLTMAVLILPLVLLLVTDTKRPLWMVVPFHLLAFFVTSLVCHGELARDRPRPERLTEYYLLMSVGGLLGGLFNTLIAPSVFTRVAEYPLMLAVACLLRPADTGLSTRLQRVLDVAVPLVLAAATVGVVLGARHLGARESVRLASLGGVLLFAFLASSRPLRFGLAVGAVLLAGFLTWEERSEVEHRERTFFGVYQVKMDSLTHFRTLMNGTTMHGVQSQHPGEQHEPLSYYGRSSPIGAVIDALADRLAGGNVGVIGLGTGTLAAYARPGERWTFFEIDAAVARLATDPRYFTYLSDCGETCQVALGDARLTLSALPAGVFSLLVLDAFSSDAIPVHLATREAVALYVDKLAPGGVVAFHVSNRHVDLRPVLGRLARDLGLQALAMSHDVSSEESAAGLSGSDWVVLGRTSADLEPISATGRWSSLDGSAGPGWTDDFSNILAVLDWK